jgi:hypothetical protein
VPINETTNLKCFPTQHQIRFICKKAIL